VYSNVCSFQSLYSLGRCSVNTEGLIGQDAQPDAPAHRWLHPMMPNQPDGANPAMAPGFMLGFGGAGSLIRNIGRRDTPP
jgi:hypothetical protein